MRSALDATPLLGARTGVATFTAGLLGGLVGQPELEVYAYALSWRGRTMLREVLPAGVTSGWAVPAGPLLRLWGRSDLVSAELILDKDEDMDIVHGTNFVVPPAKRAARVVTVHDLTCVRYPEMCTRTTLRYPGLLRRAIDRGAWVHTPSEHVAAEVREVFGATRVRAIPHGVAADGHADPGAGRALAASLTGCEQYILSIATAEPRKDLPTLIGAFDQLAGGHPGVGLVLAGGRGWGAEPVDAAVDHAAHKKRIGRPGYVSDDVRASLLAGAAAFAFAPRYEGFGLPPLEAMAAGVPVVATDAGAVREVCDDAALIVPVGDRDAFAHALAEVLDGRGADLATRGRARAAAYTWDRCAAEMAALYRDCVADRE